MIPSTRKPAKLANRRTGAVAPLVGILLLVILVAGGIAIDHARLRLAHLELRAAADNVARSVSNEMLRTDSQDAAIAKGQEIAAKYRVGGDTFSLQSGDIQFGTFTKGEFKAGTTKNTAPNAVRVNTNRSSGSSAGPLNMIFGSMFGVNDANLGQFATASFKMVDICFVLDRSSSMKLTVDSNAVGLSMSDPRAATPPYLDSRWRALHTAFDMFIDELNNNMTIHTITFGDYADKSLMAEIAVTGNGRYAHADDAAGLQKLLRDLAVTLTTLVE